MRQRVRHQCCTRGRSRPAHPRQLAGVLMLEPIARRFVCARCRAPVLVCSRCDRGQIYCASGCAAMARCESQRAAGRRYQCSRPGCFRHAARTRRWRERQALSARLAAVSPAQSVTHQGSPATTSDAVLGAHPLSMPGAAGPAAQPCTTLTTLIASSTSTPVTPCSGDSVPTPALTIIATTPVWQCSWCRTTCAPRVRLDFLRHSRPPRGTSRRREPTHGHSP
jgi:hypothetical protein